MMTTIDSLRAERLLHLAERFLFEGAPWDAIQSAGLASQLDLGVQKSARDIVRQAAELPWNLPKPVSGNIERLRRFVARLQAGVAGERELRLSNSVGTTSPDISQAQPGNALPPELRAELTRILHHLKNRDGRRFERARAVARALLQRCPPVESDSNEKESEDPPWEEFISLEHALHNLGNTLYKLERYEEGIEMYDVSVYVNPDLVETYFNRGLAYTRLGRYERAEEDLNKVIDLNAKLAEAWYTRGLVREYKLDYDGAIADYGQAIEVDGSYHKAESQRDIARRKRDSFGKNQRSPDSNDSEGVVKDYSLFRVKPDCRLSQVGDHPTVKREFRKILTYLSGGQLLDEWGGEVPRGVLLYGEAGVGKTHLARALAGEAEVPFYAPPMSLIFDMYVGNSEKNIRNLFEAASQHKRAIVFFDELDVIASHRNESRRAQEPWHARLSACLLEELDNIAHRNRGVVVVGATNSLEAVDSAFLRPGRFTYVLEVDRPGEMGMVEILLICLETASLRAKREDFLDTTLERAVLAARQEWIQQALSSDDTGLIEVIRIAVQREMVGDDVREVVRRVIDERIIAGLDGVDLGPISVEDLRRHVEEYAVVRRN